MNNSILTAIAAAAVTVCVSPASFALAQPAGGNPGAGAASPGSGGGALSGIGSPVSSDPDWRRVSAVFGGVETDTEPSRDVVMRFSFPTEVREVLVVGGQRVKQGDLLVRARDADAKAALEQQRLRANNELEIRAAEAAVEIAAFRFKNLSEARTRDAGSAAEFEERRIELKQAEIQLEQTKIRLTEQRLALEQLEGQFERLRLEAPFDGIIEEMMVDAGQGVGEQVPVLRIVNTDKLWLDAYPRTVETLELGLSEGSRAWVLLDLPGGARMTEGTVLYVSPVADSVSQRRRVRVEISNPGGHPAGTAAMVRFAEPSPPPGGGAWALLESSVAVRSAGEAGSEGAR